MILYFENLSLRVMTRRHGCFHQLSKYGRVFVTHIIMIMIINKRVVDRFPHNYFHTFIYRQISILIVDCIADSIIGSWLITTVIVIILATVKTHAISDAIFECCPENSVPICSTKNCADGSRVRLYCPNDGSFHRLNPEAYDFDTSQDDLKFIYRNVSIPATKFCVSGKHEKDRWAFVCSNDENEDDSIAKFAVLGIQNIMSAVFLFLIWAIYLILPDLRNIQDKAVARIVAFLACGCMLLAMTQLRIYDDCLCIPVGKFVERY